jgi:predicted DNA-binding protein with PD1-like motif
MAHMETKLLHSDGGRNTFIAVLETGEEVMECLKAVASRQNLSAAQITAIGAFSDAMLFFFDWEEKEYASIPVNEQTEVASMIGDIAADESGAPALHVHVVLGRRDGTAIAGHLDRAHVRPTLEVLITETPAHLRRVEDASTGLALIRPHA